MGRNDPTNADWNAITPLVPRGHRGNEQNVRDGRDHINGNGCLLDGSCRATRRAVLRQAAFAIAAIAVAKFAPEAHAAGTTSVKDYGALGDGHADDTSSFEKAVRSGVSNITIPKGTYRLTRQIVIPSGVALQGLDNPLIVLDVRFFDETSIPRAYATNACPLLFHGNRGGGVFGLTFTPSAYGSELVVMAIALRGCSEVHVRNCTFHGFSKTKIIRIDSSSNCIIEANQFYDCRLSSVGRAQLTCIDVDDNRVAGGSSNLRIIGNMIRNITVSRTFLAEYGNQTDGINISHETSSHHLIANNMIDTVGEGVDCFGHDCLIEGNVLRNCHNFGVKLIHGAHRNMVRGNRIETPGLGGIVLTGSGANATDTAQNTVTNNLISGVGAYNQWPGATTFGIKLEDDHGARTARDNIIRANTIERGPRMEIGILIVNQAAGNVITDNSVEGYVRADYVLTKPSLQTLKRKAAK